MHPLVLDLLREVGRCEGTEVDPRIAGTARRLSEALEGAEAELRLTVEVYELTCQRLLNINCDMSAVLEHVAQGLVSVSLDGKPTDVPSRTLERWFGPVSRSVPIWDYLFAHDLTRSAWTRICFDALAAGAMPPEVVLAQLTTVTERSGRRLRVEYQPFEAPQTALLVVVSDVTDELARAEDDRLQREVLALVERERTDPVTVAELITSTDDLLAGIARSDIDTGSLMSRLHTVKGMTSLFGIASVASACEAAETAASELGGRPSPATLMGIVSAWCLLRARARPFLERHGPDMLVVARREYDEVLASLPRDQEAVRRMHAWREVPTRPHLVQCADRIRQLSRRLGKDEPAVHVDDGGVRIDSARFAPVWLALVHAIRNVVAHASEPAATRVAHGKPAQLRVDLVSRRTEAATEIEIRDDGAGIDWAVVEARARALGLPSGRDAVFAAGVTTRLDAETDDSAGRGVGLTALRAACESVGGSVAIASEHGAGTVVLCRIPHTTVVQEVLACPA